MFNPVKEYSELKRGVPCSAKEWESAVLSFMAYMYVSTFLHAGLPTRLRRRLFYVQGGVLMAGLVIRKWSESRV